MDLRDVRTAFYEKKLAYACSYDPKLYFDIAHASVLPNGLRVPIRQRRGVAEASTVFHVLDAATITGVDGRRHNCPTGKIEDVDEWIVFRSDAPIGEIDGRLYFTTDDGAVIEATYTGVVRFPAHPVAFLTDPIGGIYRRQPVDSRSAEVMQLEGNVRLVPTFITADSRYRWLGEHACVAFGVWAVEQRVQRTRHNLTVRLDVYSAG